jgi:serine protease AprX
MSCTVSRQFRLSVLAAGMLASGLALAEAQIDPELARLMAAAAPTHELHVVVSFEQSGPVTSEQVSALQGLGIERGVHMRSLPIVGALATPEEIRALARRNDVVSIFWNAPLQHFNRGPRQISGAARVVENQADFGRALPYSGRGVTVMVNDSGIDATHEDIKLGENVVQNVLAPQNILAALASDLVGPGIVPMTYVEGVHNTDLGGSGHGTHVAGTVGGTGERSGGLYRGVAPGARMVGYGSGGALFILDAVGGLDYSATHQFSFAYPIRITSNSWGTSGPFNHLHPVNIATYELYKRGILSVFAAGNSGPDENTHNPYAQAPWVVSVGAGEISGVLASFSSRGNRGESRTFTMPDGRTWTHINQPTIVATGVDVISARASTNALSALSAEQDAAVIAPAHLPFYTHASGTSMATPLVSGILALMFEANPNLTPAQAKTILRRTATNMTGRLAWEVGAGHVNAYAAVAMAQGLRTDYGRTVNMLREFNSNALLAPGAAPLPFSIFFTPVGAVETKSFQVGPEVAFVTARATVNANTVALVLIDPDGNRFGSSVALPLLGSTITTGAPGKPGTWGITVRGIGSVSGVGLDPARVTNGIAAPGTVSGQISFLNSGGFTGLDDVHGHPARTAIEFAVANRLVDGRSDRRFRPDQALSRSEFAQYLVMGASVRQALPLSGVPSFTDLAPSTREYAYAEAAIARGAPLRDLGHDDDGVMRLIGGQFRPWNSVSRLDLAYALVQAQGLQDLARAHTGPLTAFFDGRRIPLQDAATIPAEMRGYVQLALDTGVINARFALVQGPFDLQPTVQAYFDPNLSVTRAAYAVAAGRFLVRYRSAED